MIKDTLVSLILKSKKERYLGKISTEEGNYYYSIFDKDNVYSFWRYVNSKLVLDEGGLNLVEFQFKLYMLENREV